MKTEFAVFWKRVGLKPKVKVFKSRRGAEDYRQLLGPEPWKYWRKSPTDFICCSGHECNCMGVTVEQDVANRRDAMPELEYVGVKVRAVTDWVEESREVLIDPELGEKDTDAGREDHYANLTAGIKTGLDATNDDRFW